MEQRRRNGGIEEGSEKEGEKKKRRKKFARSIFLSQLQCVEGFSDNPADKVHNSGVEGFSFSELSIIHLRKKLF